MNSISHSTAPSYLSDILALNDEPTHCEFCLIKQDRVSDLSSWSIIVLDIDGVISNGKPNTAFASENLLRVLARVVEAGRKVGIVLSSDRRRKKTTQLLRDISLVNHPWRHFLIGRCEEDMINKEHFNRGALIDRWYLHHSRPEHVIAIDDNPIGKCKVAEYNTVETDFSLLFDRVSAEWAIELALPLDGLLALLGKKLLGPADITWQPTPSHTTESRFTQIKNLVFQEGREGCVIEWFQSNLSSLDPRDAFKVRELVSLVERCPQDLLTEQQRDILLVAYVDAQKRVAAGYKDVSKRAEIIPQTISRGLFRIRRPCMSISVRAVGINFDFKKCAWNQTSVEILGQNSALNLKRWSIEELVLTEPGERLIMKLPWHLRSLILTDRGLDFLEPLQRLPALTKLTVLGVSCGEISARVARTLRHFPELAHLTVQVDQSEPELLKSLACIRNLKTLSLIKPSSEALEILVSFIPKGSFPEVEALL